MGKPTKASTAFTAAAAEARKLLGPLYDKRSEMHKVLALMEEDIAKYEIVASLDGTTGNGWAQSGTQMVAGKELSGASPQASVPFGPRKRAKKKATMGETNASRWLQLGKILGRFPDGLSKADLLLQCAKFDILISELAVSTVLRIARTEGKATLTNGLWALPATTPAGAPE